MTIGVYLHLSGLCKICDTDSAFDDISVSEFHISASREIEDETMIRGGFEDAH
jgi:hypothetical protein